MNSVKLYSLLAAIGLALILSPRSSDAEPNADAARAHYDRGKALAERGEYAAAYGEFEAGYQASPRPAFLFNMGEAARGMGHTDKARAAYQRYLAAEPNGPLADTARKRLAQLGPAGTTASAPSSTSPSRDTSPPPVGAPPRGTASPSRGTSPPAVGVPPRGSVNPPGGTASDPGTANPPVSAGSPPGTVPAPHDSSLRPGVPPVPSHLGGPSWTPAETPPAAALDLRMPPPRPTSRPVWKRTWFWVGVGVGVATAAVAGAVVLARPEACSPPACIDLRN